MNNERGLTLVELLATLAILGVILAVIGGALINGLKASDRNATNQLLQQEANSIIESVREEYLSSKISIMQLVIEKDVVKLNSNVISSGYEYSFYKIVDDEIIIIDDEDELLIYKTEPFLLQLRISKGEDSTETLDIHTTFSKLQRGGN